jgi:chaperonin GroES
MTIKPLFDYVLIEKDEEISKTSGGLVLPDSSKEKPSTGTVLEIGGGAICEQTGTTIPMFVAVGDRVIFPKSIGKTIVVDGDEKTLLRQTDILGIIK